MQRAQRGLDNPALEVAVQAANALAKPAVVFFAPVPFYPRANLRHYRFLAQGIPDIAESLRKRNIGFVLRRFPEHSLTKFCEEIRPSLVVGDENPMREPSPGGAQPPRNSAPLSGPLTQMSSCPRNCWKKRSTRRTSSGRDYRRNSGASSSAEKYKSRSSVEKAAGVAVARPGV